MALPASRDFDAVDAGPMPHTTVNNLQDGVVDHEARVIVEELNVDNLEKKGYTIAAEDGIRAGGSTYNIPGKYVAAVTGTDSVIINMKPPAALLGFGNEVEEIKTILVAVNQATAAPITITVEQLLDFGAVNKTVTKVASVTTGNKVITLDAALADMPLELLLQFRYLLTIDFGAALDRFFEARVNIGRV